MAKPSQKILDFMAEYDIDSDEIWEVRPGTWAVKHSALERAAVKHKIDLVKLEVISLNQTEKMAAVKATMKQGDRLVESFGEAAPYNSKNGYPVAMSEKRAIDRCILKLLQTHGAIYSESEADEFGDPDQSEKGTLLRSSQYAREEYKKLIKGMDECTTGARLEEWARAYREQIRACPFVNELRDYYTCRLVDLTGNTERSSGNGVVRAAR